LIAQQSFHAQKESQRASRHRSRDAPQHEAISKNGFHAISFLSVVLRFHRLCKPANPAFTMSEIRDQESDIKDARTDPSWISVSVYAPSV
jgi:hypothetical protein